jgi:predicted lipid-binding transport protein (Tim44 family)
LTSAPRADATSAETAVKPLQILELVIFAALAAVLLYQLYAVLGRRVGRQPGEGGLIQTPRFLRPRDAAPAPDKPVDPALAGLPALKARDSSFDPAKFLLGARTAYEMIVKAFVAGDRDALKPLTEPKVFEAFDRAIAEREAASRTETIDFLQPVRADLEAAEVEGEKAKLKVRFLAEFRARTKDAAGEAVDDRRTAEVWTFSRLLSSRDPNWTLARVDAAEA